MNSLDIYGVLGMLRREIDRAGSQRAFADLHGLQTSTVNDAINGIPGKAVLRALGLKIVTLYQPINKNPETPDLGAA